ncbi:MAG: hypothetical protein JWM80_1422 [Cyanobacteria bacterium RYN_339]|nr:hypothetical protein [Cyanobacteria bacterium RYN_339]
MFWIANFLFILIAGTNLYGVLAGKAPTVRQISTELVGEPGGLDRLRAALTLAALAQVYLISLVFPLKALNPSLGLAWAVMMLGSVLESIHTSRKMYTTAAGASRDVAFPLHDSGYYRAYQVVFNLATIAVCAYLLFPR